ncbi:FAD binding domain-containing protein [Tricladium varicosporioides]|nr:FAD binding domain-containing protein [Hymenoscyphus varicosporioides]
MGSIEEETRHVDVLVVGGGPVGLVMALQLLKFSRSTTVTTIEKYSKSTQDTYGRAITLYPRTCEMLDQLGLADSLAQKCFACRDTVSYDRNGKEVMGRGWAFMESMGKENWTQWDFALVLRQRYQEEIFRQKLKDLGGKLETEKEIIGIEIDESIEKGGYRVHASVKNVVTGKVETIICRYLVGADGGRSFVRRALDIPFEGSTTEDKWVRIDGPLKTDMPKSRGYGAIESPTHGNVLWAALDHGATRIGFAFTAERQKGYTEFNEAAAVAEAIESVRPFKVEFEKVDWFTVYAVGQRVAKQFFTKDCVFLAGDACHTHSSGAAQGMNTGIHDAVNLGWKLSLVVRGLAPTSLLSTYESERLPNVQKLINYDKDISRLMTMQLPLGWTGDSNADPNEILGVVMAEAAAFTSGLNISFDNNILNTHGSLSTSSASVSAGKRGPDVLLQKPGTFEGTRLHRETENIAKFHVVVFVGDTESTCSSLRGFSTAIENSKIFSDDLAISWLTIIAGRSPSPFETLGRSPLGRVFFDAEKLAHSRYGVNMKEGAVFVLRPDGWIGAAMALKVEAVDEIETYFKGILTIK